MSDPSPAAAAPVLDLSQPPPVAERRPHEVSLHGETRGDDYFWLREKESPAVRVHLEAENAHTARALAPLEPLRARLYHEMIGRIQETDSSPPVRFGAWRYYHRTFAGKQYPLYCRRGLAPDAPEQVLLDLNALAAGTPFLALGDYAISDDGRFLAYTLDRTGYRVYEVFVRDLVTGAMLPQAIGPVSSLEWAADNDTLVYIAEDAAKRDYRLARWTLSTGAHAVIFDEADDLFDVSLDRSRDGLWLFATSGSSETTEVRAVRAHEPAAPWQVILPREEDHEYYVEHRFGHFWMLTNRDAENFRLVTAPAATPDPAHWQEVLPHRPEVKLEGLEVFAGHVVVEEREDGLPQLRVLDLASGEQHRIALPEPVYELESDANYTFDTTTFRYRYESPVTPKSVFDYDLASRATTLVKQTPVLGAFRREDYRAERVWVTATDGTRIPVSLVYRIDRRATGAQPLLLTGYGSYGYSLPDNFSATRLALLDRGVIYAIAHIRGGGELGEAWHEQGKMAAKMNTFTDFIACAEHLIAAGYTRPAQLAITGGSAGGLLMGAVVNLRPELFRVVVADVPFVDVVNTMLDATLPLTTGEYLEWGNPKKRAEYRWIRAYSPYDNLRPQAYPTMLVTASLHDSQVPYWEAAKYVAKLRAVQTGTNPVLLRTDLAAGHGGASGRYDALREQAQDYAFLLAQLGLGDS